MRKISLVLLVGVLTGFSVWVAKGGYKRWRPPEASMRQTLMFPIRSELGKIASPAGSGSNFLWDEGRILADTEGAIAELALHYAPDLEMHLESAFRDLFAKLPGGMRLQICCASEEAVEVFIARWGKQARARGREVVLANLDRELSLWSRDRRIARHNARFEPARVFVPTPLPFYEPDKQSDLQVPSLLWPSGLVPGTTLVSFHLEGGNVVANQRHLFTGLNVFHENQDKFSDEKNLVQMLRDLFGREPVLLRDRRDQVPWVHTDMYLTPLNEKLVLLADPTEGSERFQAWQNSAAGSSTEAASRPAEGMRPNQLLVDPGFRESLEDVRVRLEELGYEVRRLPAVVNMAEEWMVTYNNVLMDWRGGHKVVYMPVYDLPVLDAAAAAIYRELGFEVRTVDVTGVYQLGGAIRCLANVTWRVPAARPSSEDCASCLGPLQIIASPFVGETDGGMGWRVPAEAK